MNGFDEVHLPLPLALGATGGPARRVEVIELVSGAEVRNAVQGVARRRWDIGGAITSARMLQDVVAFFEARGGRLRGFRFRDVMDDRSCAVGDVPSAMDQVIGMGDGGARSFELVKDYGGWARRIWKPVAGSAAVSVDGVPVAFALDETTGVVTLDDAPLAGVEVRAGFLFDCAVRFDVDALEVSMEAFGAGRIISVPLVELVEVSHG